MRPLLGWSVVPVCWLLVAGCAVAETAPLSLEPAQADTPVVEEAAPVAEPEPEEPSLQERWAAPFAVSSSGRPVPRAPRSVVVVRPPAAAVAAASAPAARPPARDTAAAASRPPARPAAPPVAATRTHRVEWGETWYGIARQYGVAPRELAAANPDVDPEQLRSGAVLRVPRSSAPATARRTHTVGAGDSLWGIARRYGVTAEALRKANQLRDDRVRLGQTLVIPQGEVR